MKAIMPAMSFLRYWTEAEELPAWSEYEQAVTRPLKNGNLLRQRKNPDRLCMWNTLRALDFLASLHLTIFERPA
jgi:hypothetical protein